MKSRPIIFAACASFAILAAIAAAPTPGPVPEERRGVDPFAPSVVLVTGSTHSAAGAAQGGASGVELPEQAVPADGSSRILLPSDIPALPEASKDTALPGNRMTIIHHGDRLEISGAVARLEEHDLFMAAAEKAFPTFAVEARLVQEANLADGRDEAGLLALSALSRLAEGRAEISGSEITVTGRALYAQIPELLAARLADETPAGWSLSLDIDAPERITANGGAQCQQGIVELLAEDQIGFAVAAAALEPDAEPLLDELAEILEQCPNAAVEVAGHTDSDGSEAANRRLSQERAAAVRRALAERGVEAERLSAVGYGQARPVAPNDTPENKARNRRIELIVIE